MANYPLAYARGSVSKKRMGVKPPHGLTPDGHLRGLPQSFTRSQKERPLSESIVPAARRALVAIVLRVRDEFTTRRAYWFWRLKASSGTGTSNFTSRSFINVSPMLVVLDTRVNGIITPSTGR